MARAGKMTALKVAAIARAKAPGYYGDGGGLFLQVSRFGHRVVGVPLPGRRFSSG